MAEKEVEVFETTAGQVTDVLKRLAVAKERIVAVAVMIEPDDRLTKARQESRRLVIAAGLTDEHIDRLIKARSKAMRTLANLGNNGHRALMEALANSEWKTVEQALASLTDCASPSTVEEMKRRPVFRIIRGSQRGEIDFQNQVMFDIDGNHGPIFAFCWATGFDGGKNYLQFNHIYGGRTERKNVELFTNLANICVTPTFLGKVTDKYCAPLLKSRAWDLFRLRSPDGAIPPKPDGYDQLEWAPPLDALSDVEGRMRDIMSTKPKDSATRSVRELGWVFSSFQPDPTIERKTSKPPLHGTKLTGVTRNNGLRESLAR